jgi:hypothetical protein
MADYSTHTSWSPPWLSLRANGRLSGPHVSLTVAIDFQLHGASRVGRSNAGGAPLPLFSACGSVAALLQAMLTGSQVSVSQACFKLGFPGTPHLELEVGHLPAADAAISAPRADAAPTLISDSEATASSCGAAAPQAVRRADPGSGTGTTAFSRTAVRRYRCPGLVSERPVRMTW